MVTITNNSRLETQESYFYINNVLFVFEINSDLINILKRKKDIKTVLISLYDIYQDNNTIITETDKLFKYLIYEDQYFTHCDFCIKCYNSSLYNALEQLILEDQKLIIQTGEIWPKVEPRFIEESNISNNSEFIINTRDNFRELISWRLNFSLTSEFLEAHVTENELTGYVNDYSIPKGVYSGTPPESTGLKETFNMVYIEYIQHHILTVEVNKNISCFYNQISTSIDKPDGNIIIDISNTIKKTRRLFTPEEKNIFKNAIIKLSGKYNE